MSNQEKILSDREQTLIALLVQGKSQSEAARLLDVSHKTVQRWLAYPHVDRAYREIRDNVSAHVRKEVEALSTKAVTALDELLGSKAPMAKLGAVKLVLDRIVPERQEVATAQEQEGYIPRDLLQYATNDELEATEKFVQLLLDRKIKAEADREKLERRA